MGWLILAGFVGYWYLLKKGTTQSLVDVIRNEWSKFSAYNQAGLATGSADDPGSHESYPGAFWGVPLGIATAEPGSTANLISSSTPVAAVPSRLGTVPARTGSATVPVGALRGTYYKGYPIRQPLGPGRM